MFLALLVITVLLVTAALLPLLSHEAWVVRSFDFPRLQISFLLLVLLAAQFFLLDLSDWRSWLLIGAAFAALVYESWWIIRYSPLFPKEVLSASQRDPEREIRIMNVNVLMSNRQADELLALVHDSEPDLLVVLESNHWWQQQLRPLESDYPHTVKCPLENRYGMHIYSRLPLEDSFVQYLVEDDKPSVHARVTLHCGAKIACHFLHPSPPSPTEKPESAERDAELMVVARSIAKMNGPVIVSGDLNDVAWSRTTRAFRKISGLLDPRVGRGMFNTFHAQHWFMRWPLDHLFHSRHFTLISMRRRGGFGSDHFALVTELYYEGGPREQQEALDADPEDRRWAAAKHRKEGARVGDVAKPERD